MIKNEFWARIKDGKILVDAATNIATEAIAPFES